MIVRRRGNDCKAYAGKNKRTGKPFQSEFAHILTVDGDKVTGFKEFTDTAATLAAAH